MHALLHGHGWGALLMIAAIVGWSALMLLLVYLLAKLWHRYPTPGSSAGQRSSRTRLP